VSAFTYQPTLTLGVRRCYRCGKYYAAEDGAHSMARLCAACLWSDRDELRGKLATAERAVSQLRALAKRRKRGAK
jgi:hypothetical protein